MCTSWAHLSVLVRALNCQPLPASPPRFENLGHPAFSAGHAVVENVWSNREETAGPFDAVVYAYGGVAVNGLQEQLSGRVDRVELVGDCFAPRSLQHAILEGHQIGRQI